MLKVIHDLSRDHRNMERLLVVIERQMDSHRAGGALDIDLLQSILDYILNYPDLVHHPKEDLIFERLRQVDPEGAALVADVLGEHPALCQATECFASTLNNVAKDAEVPRQWFEAIARGYIDKTRAHMLQEEKVFFPRALARLKDEDWRAIDAAGAGAAPADPLFGPTVEGKYLALHERILELAR
jgi:hemerythrin-like domain-containing protein